jgi:hypothetical protein
MLRFAVWMAVCLLAIPIAAQEPLRLSVGGGYGAGTNNGTYHIDQGDLALNSVTGGSGPLLTANLWLDGAPFSDFSLGLEALRLINSATASLSLPHGASILTDPIGGSAKLTASADLAFLDLVYRPQLQDKRFAFFIGGGLGGGFGRASARFSIDNPALGDFAQASSVNSAIGGLHGLMGIDFYLTKSLFISVSPQLLYLSGHPVGVQQSYLDLMITSSIGFSF